MTYKIILLSMVLLLLNSCLEDNNDTLVIPDVKYSYTLESILPNFLLLALKENMPIYEGTTPPNIEGAYDINPNIVHYFSDGNFDKGTVLANRVIKFSNQNEETRVITYQDKQGFASASDQSYSDHVSIIGSGNNFTAFFKISGVSREINYTGVTVVSGTYTAEGIKDIYKAFVVLTKDPDPDKLFVEINNIRITSDRDSLASNTTW